MIDFLNNLFYGDNWYIYWGIIALLFFLGLLTQLPMLIKAVKEKKKK